MTSDGAQKSGKLHEMPCNQWFSGSSVANRKERACSFVFWAKEMKDAQTSLLEAFLELSDPRERECEHKPEELLLVAICAVISGAGSWTSVAEWGRLKLDWLRRHLPFANGIASHDTLGRVFTLLGTRQFEACFLRWVQQLDPGVEGQHLAIGGKSVRRSHKGERARFIWYRRGASRRG
jgi:hypothetical protein